MTISAWKIASLREVEWYIQKRKSLWPRFDHASTTVSTNSSSRLASGTTMWLGEVSQQCVGLAWDWTEVGPGVVAMADPNGICSNLRFLRDEDHFESELSSSISLARLVHALPWQPVVALAIEPKGQPTRRSTAAAGRRGAPRMAGGSRALNAKYL